MDVKTFSPVPIQQAKKLSACLEMNQLNSIGFYLLVVVSSLILQGCASVPQTTTQQSGKFSQPASRSTDMILLMENADEAYVSGNWGV